MTPRVLYSDDLTHIQTCESPYHRKGEPFREAMIFADVDEVADAGADVHMLQPGLGWTPLWWSAVYPFGEHYTWAKDRYGCVDSIFDAYMLAGGDIVRAFVNRCRQRGTGPFISLRMNDYHGKELLDLSRDKLEDTTMPMTLCASRFQAEHRDWRIGPEPGETKRVVDEAAFLRDRGLRTRTRHARVLDWAIPEVREHKFSFIRELCENYDIDGFELDFMRDSRLFRQDATTSAQRREIMAGYCARVRGLLDRTARPEQPRRLCVRIPHHQEIHDALGIDVKAWHEAGVNMFNLSCHYATEQQTQLPQIIRQAPGADHYLEMTQTPMRLQRDGVEEFRMTTREQFRTTAHLAHAQGAAGVSLFNFMYYRPHGERGDAVYTEPPFDVVADLKNPADLGDYPQHYFVGPGSNVWGVPGFSLPRLLNPGQLDAFTLEMAPPRGGWQGDGRLRVQLSAPHTDCAFEAAFNGFTPKETADVSEPFPTGYTRHGALGGPGELYAWIVPHAIMRPGANVFELTLISGAPATVVFVDLAVLNSPDRRT